MPRRFKGEPLFTAVQSELFDTDIEEFSAQADERWALFQSPPTPEAPVPVYVRTRPLQGAHLAGVFGFLERPRDMSNLAQSSP